jgi:DNA-binding CsgD family transcriptional regulator
MFARGNEGKLNTKKGQRVGVVDANSVHSIGLVQLLSRAFVVSGVARTLGEALNWDVDVLVVSAAGVGMSNLRDDLSVVPLATSVLIIAPDDQVVAWRKLPGVHAAVGDSVTEAALLEEVFRVARKAADARPDQAYRVRTTIDDLSPREREVLHHIARGHTHAEAAVLAGISRHTVDTYVKRIKEKLGVGNKAEMTRAAVLGGLVRSPSSADPPVLIKWDRRSADPLSKDAA